MEGISLKELRREALALVAGTDDGPPLDAATAALIDFSVRISVTAMDVDGARASAKQAVNSGATPQQLHEALFLVSGLGVHSLFSGTKIISEFSETIDGLRSTSDLSDHESLVWRKRVGPGNYWKQFNKEIPGVLETLLRQSPLGFEAFFDYCAVPWKSEFLPAVTKEIISMAVDSTPTHRYLPGMRLHLKNALRLGAGRIAVLQAIDLAADAPMHVGIVQIEL